MLDEKRNLRRLRWLVDLTSSILYQDPQLTFPQAMELVQVTERAILKIFPDKQFAYDLILKPRFERILLERWPPQPSGNVN